jgi:hypothetical protein
LGGNKGAGQIEGRCRQVQKSGGISEYQSSMPLPGMPTVKDTTTVTCTLAMIYDRS